MENARVHTGTTAPYEWTRKYFDHLPGRADLADHLPEKHTFVGTSLDALARSTGGLDDALLALPRPGAAPGRARRLWHGRRPLRAETFQGWFGAHVQPVRPSTFNALLDRLGHVLVADASTSPTYVIPLRQYVRLGASHGVLESALDAPVMVATDALYSRAAYVTSMRFHAAYDGLRYARSTRKLFRNPTGAAATVESVARDLLAARGVQTVHPVVFHRIFSALVGRPSLHFHPDHWPTAFANGRLSPLEWVLRAQERLREARAKGYRAAIEDALAEVANRPLERLEPRPPGSLPLVGRHLSRDRFETLLDSVADDRLHALFEGLLCGYEAASADWFAWQPGTDRAFFCEVKSRGDTLRPAQKETILWCQQSGVLEYRLLEVLHPNVTTEAFSTAPTVVPGCEPSSTSSTAT